MGPTFANFFLGHIEKTMFDGIAFAPKFYCRYVDDIFAVFENEEQKQAFFNHLNNLHQNLKFTVEDAVNNILPFLDVKVELGLDGVETSVYRKPTHTGVFLNFKSIAPMQWKNGLIYGMLHRAYLICSSTNLFNKEVDKLRAMFINNSYSVAFFNKVVAKFRANVGVPRSNVDQIEETKGPVFKIPFVGLPSIVLKNDISKLFFQRFHIKLRGTFTTCKVGDFFSLKSCVPLAIRSNVVYKFTCLCDTSKFYLGKTKRHLVTRVGEHLGPQEKSPTAVNAHRSTCVPCQSATFDNFQVLRSCRDDYEVSIHEALMIRKSQPALNKQAPNMGASLLLKVF